MNIALFVIATIFLSLGITEIILASVYIKRSEDVMSNCGRYLKVGGRISGFGLLSVIFSIAGAIGVTEQENRADAPWVIVVCLLLAVACYALLILFWIRKSRQLGLVNKEYYTFMNEYRLHFKGIYVSGFLFAWAIFFWLLLESRIISFISILFIMDER